jgi:hypothetical protein
MIAWARRMKSSGSMRSLCLLVLVASAPVRADELEPIAALDLPTDHGELRLSAFATPTDGFGSGSYGATGLALAAALPLYTSRHWRLLAQLRAGVEDTHGSALPGDETVTEDALGLTGVYISERRDVYALYAGASIAETRDTIAHPTIMPSIVGLGSYRDDSITWLYGGGFGEALGRSLPLPIAGLSWRMSTTWTLTVLLPVEAELRHRFGDAFDLGVIAAVSGDRYHLSDALTLQLGELRTGVQARYRFGDHWSVTAELGVLAPRRLELADISFTSDGTLYVATGARYAFDAFRR